MVLHILRLYSEEGSRIFSKGFQVYRKLHGVASVNRHDHCREDHKSRVAKCVLFIGYMHCSVKIVMYH